MLAKSIYCVYKLSRRKALKKLQTKYWQHLRKTREFLSCHQPERYFSSHKKYAHLSFFAKVYLQFPDPARWKHLNGTKLFDNVCVPTYNCHCLQK